ncbi:MAG: tryptophan--tRNA ligase [Candidatus Altiarchaeota archaeon]
MVESIDPWGSSTIGDYESLFSGFGIKPFSEFKKRFNENRYVRRGIIFGHRDFANITKAIDKKMPWAMMTGLMPSGNFHLGHKMVADEIIWFQKLGGEIFVCAADIEAYATRNISLAEGKKIALEQYLTNYIALGLDPKVNFHFWFQSDYVNPYYRMRDMLTKYVTFNELSAIYGELSPGKIISVLTQVADILHPQLPEMGGQKMPVVVPVGADQDPHIRLTRDIAFRASVATIPSNDGRSSIRIHPENVKIKGNNNGKVMFFGKEISNEELKKKRDFDLFLPSSTYHKFMRGLTGEKMSSADPQTHIALLEEPESAAKKVMRAKTGGRNTAEEQKKLGGVPKDCVVYELYVYHLIDDDEELREVYAECTGGTRTCGDCKSQCAEILREFLIAHQKKIPRARKLAEKIVSD